MAYKYKLNELSSDVLSKIGTFIKDNPKVEYIRKEFVKTPANTDESEKLDFVLRGVLEKRGGFKPLEVEKYMDFLYIERNNNVGGEWGDTQLNEEEPLTGKFADLLARFKKEDEEMGEPKLDPNAKNTFKEEQGRKNLAKEVLSKLKNR
jgi:hypothetical protein